MFVIYTCDKFNIPRFRDSFLMKSNPSYKKISRDPNIFIQHLKILLPQQNVCVCTRPITKYHFRGETKRH
jgi:hypothetical protein